MQLATINMNLKTTYSPASTLNTSQCDNCPQHETCLSNDLNEQELLTYNSINKQSKKLVKGEYLYRHGDIFDTIYMIRSGSLKTSMIDEEGREQVLNFGSQGDMIGLEGITLKPQITESKALETTFLCGIPIAQYLDLASKSPRLYQKLLYQMSSRIIQEEQHSLMLGTKNVHQKLASFLLNLAKRNSEQGFPSHDLALHMSRRDIGNYLSAAVETVSRIFTYLQEKELIEVQGKYVRIIDMNGLEKIAL
jgi:CRP/FNR family transcriptional regulator